MRASPAARNAARPAARSSEGGGQLADREKGHEVHHQSSLLTVVNGDAMTADEAGWAMIADAADRALTLPGLSADGERLLREMAASCRHAAGLPPLRSQREIAG